MENQMNNSMDNEMIQNQMHNQNSYMMGENQMNNLMYKGPTPNQMYNEMMQNKMCNEMTPNQMNNQIYNQMAPNPMNNGIIQNHINNQMYNQMTPNPMINGIIQNQMNNPMNEGILQNQMNNQIYNQMTQNPMNNGIIQNQFNYQMNNGIIQNQMNNQMYNQMATNPMNNRIMQNQMNNQMTPNPMNNGIMQNQINENPFNYLNNDNMNNMKNIPIENSIELAIDKNEKIKYYLYPKIEFTEEESNKSKVLLIIGQTGHGKTTFINALVNIYLGITFNDQFRYLLVENEKKKHTESITKEIIIYKIRPKKGLNFPPLIIIDTPGFGDTKGEKEDEKHLEKFREFFGSKIINYINCILYIIIGANSRFGEIDKKITNYLLGLFSKNVKENFVVGVTNVIPENKRDIPNIIKSLSDEDHFYYQNVLKNDKLSREQIIESDWYFASDNKIIFNNKFEGNEMEKYKWQYTENQIKNFIKNKINILEKRGVKDSHNVLNNRIQLKNEINSFKDKIESLIKKKKAYEFNLAEQEKYKNYIIETKEKIHKNNLEKVNIIQYIKEINNTLPFMKKVINKPFKSKNYNLICEECQFNCHKNCDCIFTFISELGCNMISLYGKCKICNHSVLRHKKVKLFYIQQDENEHLLNNEIEELQNYIKYISNKKKNEVLKMNNILEGNDLLQKTLEYLEKQLINCKEEIEKIKNEDLNVENEIINCLKNIKNNLDFLRNNALDKETRTISNFIEEYISNKGDKEKEIINNLYQNIIF